MRLTTLWPSGIRVDEVAEIEVFSRQLLDELTAQPHAYTSIEAPRRPVRRRSASPPEPMQPRARHRRTSPAGGGVFATLDRT